MNLDYLEIGTCDFKCECLKNENIKKIRNVC